MSYQQSQATENLKLHGGKKKRNSNWQKKWGFSIAMFDYQRDPKGSIALLCFVLLGDCLEQIRALEHIRALKHDKPPKRSTRNWLWRIIFLMEKTWGNAMNFRWPQTKWKALLGFHVSFHGRRSKESVRCHAVLSCHGIQQVHACLPAGRFLTRADDGTQKFLRSDRLTSAPNLWEPNSFIHTIQIFEW